MSPESGCPLGGKDMRSIEKPKWGAYRKDRDILAFAAAGLAEAGPGNTITNGAGMVEPRDGR